MNHFWNKYNHLLFISTHFVGNLYRKEYFHEIWAHLNCIAKFDNNDLPSNPFLIANSSLKYYNI